MLDMVKQEIIPAVFAYESDLVKLIEKKTACGFPVSPEDIILGRISELAGSLYKKVESLDNSLMDLKGRDEDSLILASFYRYTVFSLMSEVRVDVDSLEQLVAKKYWPYPSYGEMLFSI